LSVYYPCNFLYLLHCGFSLAASGTHLLLPSFPTRRSSRSHDLIKGSIKPDISERGELVAARWAMTGAIILATWLGLNPPGFAAQVVALAFGLAAATIFPALMMGIFSKKVNKKGAMAGMLVGLVF